MTVRELRRWLFQFNQDNDYVRFIANHIVIENKQHNTVGCQSDEKQD